MLNILMISNRERVRQLLDYFQPRIIGKINLAEDLDRGLNEIFNKRPALVFIQSEIFGVSADPVIKHIKGLLGAGSPRIVLLWESATASIPTIHGSDDTIDISLPTEKLFPQFQALLESIQGVQWRTVPQVPEPSKETKLTADAPAVENDQTSPTPNSSISSSISENTSLPAFEWAGKGAHQNDAPRADYFDRLGDEADLGIILRPPRRSRVWLLSVALILTFGLGLLVFYFLPIASKRNDAVPVQSIRPIQSNPVAIPSFQPTPIIRRLPSFIPLQGLDSAYSKSNPGWERYLNRQMEYLVFSENGTIKAIQVIAIKGGVVSHEFFNSALREFCGGEEFTVTSDNIKNGYDVKEGKGVDAADIVVYSKQGKIVAFVVTFP